MKKSASLQRRISCTCGGALREFFMSLLDLKCPDLLEQPQHVQLRPLFDDTAIPHAKHVDARELHWAAGCRNTRHVTRVHSTPGDAVDDQVAFGDLIVDLVRVAEIGRASCRE